MALRRTEHNFISSSRQNRSLLCIFSRTWTNGYEICRMSNHTTSWKSPLLASYQSECTSNPRESAVIRDCGYLTETVYKSNRYHNCDKRHLHNQVDGNVMFYMYSTDTVPYNVSVLSARNMWQWSPTFFSSACRGHNVYTTSEFVVAETLSSEHNPVTDMSENNPKFRAIILMNQDTAPSSNIQIQKKSVVGS